MDKKELLRKYGLGVAWELIHGKEQGEKVARVIKKIGEFEQQLLDLGTTREEINQVLQRAKKFVKKPIEEMTDRQFETLVKLIFGQKTQVGQFDRRILRRLGILFYDPAKHAKWKRARKGA